MKRSIAALAIALLLATGAFAQSTTLSGFQTAFTSFSGAMAGSLALNSTIGSNWSDAYVGSFPRFGAGVTLGSAFISVADAEPLFSALGAAALPDALKKIGVPLPAAVGTFKIGLPFLPIDVGVKGMYLPPQAGAKLEQLTKVAFEYSNFGIQVRYALLKQNLLLPNISLGASYNFQKGSIKANAGIGSEDFTLTTDQGATTITASDPALALGWQSNVFDFTAQISKQLLFLVPYVGAGYTVGKSAVTGGVSSTMSTTYTGGIPALNTWLAANGGPEISDQGFMYSGNADKPVFRVYGGLSLRIIVLDLDTQVMYVPATKALGASLTTRIQI
jgi:hypothetical protein